MATVGFIGLKSSFFWHMTWSQVEKDGTLGSLKAEKRVNGRLLASLQYEKQNWNWYHLMSKTGHNKTDLIKSVHEYKVHESPQFFGNIKRLWTLSSHVGRRRVLSQTRTASNCDKTNNNLRDLDLSHFDLKTVGWVNNDINNLCENNGISTELFILEFGASIVGVSGIDSVHLHLQWRLQKRGRQCLETEGRMTTDR